MKIVIVASRYLPHLGGVETASYNLARSFRRRGHDVLVVTNRYPRSLPAHEVIDGIHVHRLFFIFLRRRYLSLKHIRLLLASMIFFPLTTWQLARLILTYQPDVVNLQYLGSPGLFLWLLRYLLHFRLVVTLHGGDVDGEPYRNRFNRCLFGAVLARAEGITACSRALLDQALTLAPEIAPKARVIHNGVNVRLFSSAPPYGHPRPYLLAVGQLVPHKGFDHLLSAFARVMSKFPEIDLLIAGEGCERGALQAKIQALGLEQRAHLLGASSREQVASLMRGCLAVVVPSRREPFGIVALEAMAAGKAVLSTRVGGLREILGEDEVSTLPEDTEAWADRLCSWLQAPALLEQLGADNFRQAAQYDWSYIADRYLDVFDATKVRGATPRADR